MYENKETQGLSKQDKFLLDLLATSLMIGFVFLVGYLFAWLVIPVVGEEKTTDILTFVVLLPLLLVGHLIANLLVKKLVLPRYRKKSLEGLSK